ncbi:hypothetical protein K2W90_03165 [Candidatus Babeliales bacterium]|nr:hypothetical protein [Candidatus Babeliales bacterium]
MDIGMKIKLFLATAALTASYAITTFSAGPEELPQQSLFTYAGKVAKKTVKDALFVVRGNYTRGSNESIRQQRQQAKLAALYQTALSNQNNQKLGSKIAKLETKIKTSYGKNTLQALQQKCGIPLND